MKEEGGGGRGGIAPIIFPKDTVGSCWQSLCFYLLDRLVPEELIHMAMLQDVKLEMLKVLTFCLLSS